MRSLALAAPVLLLLLAPVSTAAHGGDAARPPRAVRPRIGLALGGGSARGMAHVGVLQWLHEHRIPVDAVAGTSIGGLIGASFASGMTADDLRDLLRHTDWDLMFQPDSPFDYKTFRRKQDRRSYPALLELGFRNGLSLAGGLTAGQRIALLLDRIALPYSGLKRFDDLPTPFRCVAFDLRTAEAVVLDRGPLSEAMRATMAIPGIFSPVSAGGRLLIDGGVVNNLPADIVRGMQVDAVIAVDVGRDPSVPRRLSLTTVLDHSIDAVMAAGTRRTRPAADVLIRPVAVADSATWRASDAWRESGYAAAAAHEKELMRYAVSAEEYAAYERERRERRRTDAAVVPVSMTIVGVPSGECEAIRSQLADNLGRPLDPDRIERDILRVTGSERYEYLTYRLGVGPGGPGLIIGVHPKPNGPPFLSLGLELNNIDANNFSMNAAGRITVPDLAGSGSELRGDFVLGTRMGASAELYRPLGAARLFVAPRAYAVRGMRNRFADGRLVAEYAVTRVGAGVDVGYSGGRRTEVRLGLDEARADEQLRIGSPALPEADGRERFAALQVTFDGQDSPVIASRGIYAHARLRRFFASPVARPADGAPPAAADRQAFWQAETDATAFAPVGARHRLFLRAGAGTSFDAQPSFNDFSLGGPFRMGAFSNDELRGAHFAFAAAGLARDVGRLPPFVGNHAYLVAWLDGGSAFASRASAVWHTDAGAGLVLDSLLGPVFVGGAAGPGGHYRIYFSLGPLFR